MARTTRMVPLLALALAVGSLRLGERLPASTGRALRCEAPIAVEGALRCERRPPRDLRALCLAHGRPPPPSEITVSPGDHVWLDRACPGGVVDRMAPPWIAALGVPVDINRADEAELASLPGIGPVLARRIVEGRPYGRVEALIEVRGIGPATLRRVGARVTLGRSGAPLSEGPRPRSPPPRRSTLAPPD